MERFLDGLMDPAEEAAFKKTFADADALESAKSQQETVDDALARMFDPPDASALREQLRVPPQKQARGRRALLVAAAVLLGAVGVVRLWDLVRPAAVEDGYGPQPFRTFTEVYDRAVAQGLRPDWVCEDDEEFAGAFRERLGQPMLLAQAPGVQPAGLSYCGTLSPKTMVLLARVSLGSASGEPAAGDVPVLVFVDRASSAKAASLPQASLLKLHRSTIGELVLFELSPLDTAHILPHFYDPDDTAESP